ncbi:MAG: hypothetical protein JWN99_2554 [Ilumatobacteraceae bacterium]|nr:hypothetical protein [Ilumatobacteraceae bacterium]
MAWLERHRHPSGRSRNRVRLLKVLVQPVVVIDDGQTLTELTLPGVAVTAANWPTFSAQALGDAELQALAEQLEAER